MFRFYSKVFITKRVVPENNLQDHFIATDFPGGLVVRISRSHRDGRGSIPQLGKLFLTLRLPRDASTRPNTSIEIKSTNEENSERRKCNQRNFII